MSGAEWSRVGWLMRILFAGAPSIVTQWLHNGNGEILIPAPLDDWQQGIGPVTGVYRALHSCYQILTPPEVYVLLTDDGGQVPADTSMIGLLNRGSPAIFIPNQRFVRLGNETALLYEALQILSRQLPDAGAIECGSARDCSRYFTSLRCNAPWFVLDVVHPSRHICRTSGTWMS